MFLSYQEFSCSPLTGLTQKILAGLAGCNFCGVQLSLASPVPNTHELFLCCGWYGANSCACVALNLMCIMVTEESAWEETSSALLLALDLYSLLAIGAFSLLRLLVRPPLTPVKPRDTELQHLQYAVCTHNLDQPNFSTANTKQKLYMTS